ncbi:MAG: 1-acyl-sn-glycerol-3-phosphate acyltransferase, partial [Saprospiraceae bacterium]|nr:1-acyl-sn-glycerol-3-phosphate acyltransferase [Saprospiraceae bacterium]
MSPFLSALYRFLKIIARIAIRIYYPRTTIINRAGLHFDNPAIVVSNHPNTLLDVLLSASRIHRQVCFLANAGLFKTPFTDWLFSTLYCIPIERYDDTGGKPLNNADAFARCDAFLSAGGALFIAPEGNSWMERRMQKLKTGTARIAFSAENKNNFALGLMIHPIGLTYEDPQRFGSRVLVNVGEPVRIADFQEDYAANPIEAVRKLTAFLEARMRALTIDTADEEEDQLLRVLERVQRNDHPEWTNEQHFLQTQAVLKSLRAQQQDAPEAFAVFRHQALEYRQLLDQHRLTDRALVARRRPYAGLLRWLQIPLAILGLPVFLYGWINHLLPAGIPVLLKRKLKLYPGYDGTVKLMAGIFSFPLFYWLQSEAVEAWV